MVGDRLLPGVLTCCPLLCCQCLFLHADTQLPDGFEQLMAHAVAQQQQQQQVGGQPNPLHALHRCWQHIWKQQPLEQQPIAPVTQKGCRLQQQQKSQAAWSHQRASWGCFSSIQLDQVGAGLAVNCTTHWHLHDRKAQLTTVSSAATQAHAI